MTGKRPVWIHLFFSKRWEEWREIKSTENRAPTNTLVNVHCSSNRVPTRTGNLEKWEGIFQSGKNEGILNRLEKSGKITQNTGKLGEFEINII